MIKTYQGLELSYKMKLLPKYNNELLRSWLVRNALFLNMKPSQLSTIVFQNPDIWKSDIDVQLSRKSFESFLNNVDISENNLRKSLISEKCENYYPHLNDSKQVKWLLHIGVHKIGKTKSLQYCPACISSDRVPFFRTLWRLGFLTVCHIHKICFLDCCPNCNYPINVLRFSKVDNKPFEPLSYLNCNNCSLDLKKSPHIKPCIPELYANDEHYNLFAKGHGKVGNLTFNYSHLYFDGLKRIMSFILCSKRGIDILEYIVEVYELKDDYIKSKKEVSLYSEVEQLSILMRKIGIIFSYYVMKDWPKSFINICKKFGVTKSYIYSPYLKYPYWLKRVLDCDLL